MKADNAYEEEETPKSYGGMPPAYNRCACLCHLQAGIIHFAPCCGPLFSFRPKPFPRPFPGRHGTLNQCQVREYGEGVKKIGAKALWAMDPAKRPINVIGFFTGTLAGGEDEVIVVAA
ncbi:MAG: hypothetical protein WCP53_10290, partial [Verrucomicrobiota bacterium]